MCWGERGSKGTPWALGKRLTPPTSLSLRREIAGDVRMTRSPARAPPVLAAQRLPLAQPPGWPLGRRPLPLLPLLFSLHSQDNSTLYISFTPKGTKVHHVQHTYQVCTAV